MFGQRQKDSQQSAGTQTRSEFLSHVDKALESFGSSVKSVVYFRFQEEHGLKPEEISEKPELFVETIDRFFGVGASTVKSYLEKEMRIAVTPFDLGSGSTVAIMRKARDYFAHSPK